MKYLLLFITVLFNAQVGVNNNSPNATLDILGQPTNVSKTDGLISPQLKLSELNVKTTSYGDDQIGTFIYVSDIDIAPLSNNLKNILRKGYYYLDNNKIWQPFESRTATVIFSAESGFQTINQNDISNPVSLTADDLSNTKWNNNKYTIPISGKYFITCSITLEPNGNTPRDIYVIVANNGEQSHYGNWERNTNGEFTISYNRLDEFLIGEEIGLFVYSTNSPLKIKDASIDIVILSID